MPPCTLFVAVPAAAPARASPSLPGNGRAILIFYATSIRAIRAPQDARNLSELSCACAELRPPSPSPTDPGPTGPVHSGPCRSLTTAWPTTIFTTTASLLRPHQAHAPWTLRSRTARPSGEHRSSRWPVPKAARPIARCQRRRPPQAQGTGPPSRFYSPFRPHAARPCFSAVVFLSFPRDSILRPAGLCFGCFVGCRACIHTPRALCLVVSR